MMLNQRDSPHSDNDSIPHQGQEPKSSLKPISCHEQPYHHHHHHDDPVPPPSPRPGPQPDPPHHHHHDGPDPHPGPGPIPGPRPGPPHHHHHHHHDGPDPHPGPDPRPGPGPGPGPLPGPPHHHHHHHRHHDGPGPHPGPRPGPPPGPRPGPRPGPPHHHRHHRQHHHHHPPGPPPPPGPRPGPPPPPPPHRPWYSGGQIILGSLVIAIASMSIGFNSPLAFAALGLDAGLTFILCGVFSRPQAENNATDEKKKREKGHCMTTVMVVVAFITAFALLGGSTMLFYEDSRACYFTMTPVPIFPETYAVNSSGNGTTGAITGLVGNERRRRELEAVIPIESVETVLVTEDEMTNGEMKEEVKTVAVEEESTVLVVSEEPNKSPKPELETRESVMVETEVNARQKDDDDGFDDGDDVDVDDDGDDNDDDDYDDDDHGDDDNDDYVDVYDDNEENSAFEQDFGDGVSVIYLRILIDACLAVCGLLELMLLTRGCVWTYSLERNHRHGKINFILPFFRKHARRPFSYVSLAGIGNEKI